MAKRRKTDQEKVRTRCAYFDQAGNVYKISAAKLSRLCQRDSAEVLPKLANQRGRFMTLWVTYVGKVATAVNRVDGTVIHFGADGTVDREKFAEMESIAIESVLEGRDRPDGENVIPSAARFALKRFRWQPSQAQVSAALAVHGIRW